MNCLTIVKGESRKFFIKLIMEPGKDPVNLSEWQMVIVKLKAASLPNLSFNLEGGSLFKVQPEIGGKLELNLSMEDTALLAAGPSQPIEVELLNEGTNRIIQIPGAINVIERL